eukprot:4760452-Ditylum_brightwellii.AAC.1
MQGLYWHALHYMVVLSKWIIEPGQITIDFKLAILQAAKNQFLKADINGCLSHWKQANCKKMIGYNIENEQN